MGEPARTGTATVVFTDIVASTRLRADLGDAAADELRRRHDEALRAAVASHGGAVVKGLGDGIMASFASASAAVAAAVDMQRAVARINRRARVEPLAIRVGVSAGDVVWEDGDCFGEPVIESARLCDAAQGGQIVCSDVVRALARRRGAHEFNELGPLELKGLRDPVLTWTVSWPAEAEPMPAPVALSTRAPFSFVGRESERDLITSAWKRATTGELQAVLIAGEPGVGKTRLAAEVAALLDADGALVLAGRCDEEVGSPYQPFADSLRRFAEHCADAELLERLGPGTAELTMLVPGLRTGCPSSGLSRRVMTTPGGACSSRRSSTGWRPRRRSRRSSSCSTTCTGRPSPRSCSSDTCCATVSTCRCSSWAPTGTPTSIAPTRCRKRSPTSAERRACGVSRCAGSPPTR